MPYITDPNTSSPYPLPQPSAMPIVPTITDPRMRGHHGMDKAAWHAQRDAQQMAPNPNWIPPQQRQALPMPPGMPSPTGQPAMPVDPTQQMAQPAMPVDPTQQMAQPQQMVQPQQPLYGPQAQVAANQLRGNAKSVWG